MSEGGARRNRTVSQKKRRLPTGTTNAFPSRRSRMIFSVDVITSEARPALPDLGFRGVESHVHAARHVVQAFLRGWGFRSAVTLDE